MKRLIDVADNTISGFQLFDQKKIWIKKSSKKKRTWKFLCELIFWISLVKWKIRWEKSCHFCQKCQENTAWNQGKCVFFVKKCEDLAAWFDWKFCHFCHFQYHFVVLRGVSIIEPRRGAKRPVAGSITFDLPQKNLISYPIYRSISIYRSIYIERERDAIFFSKFITPIVSKKKYQLLTTS